MQHELLNVSSRGRDWKLNFNVSKCVTLSFGSQEDNYMLSEVGLVNSTGCKKDLGVTVTTDLSWSSHLQKIIGKAYRMLGPLRRTFGKSSSIETLLDYGQVKAIILLPVVEAKFNKGYYST